MQAHVETQGEESWFVPYRTEESAELVCSSQNRGTFTHHFQKEEISSKALPVEYQKIEYVPGEIPQVVCCRLVVKSRRRQEWKIWRLRGIHLNFWLRHLQRRFLRKRIQQVCKYLLYRASTFHNGLGNCHRGAARRPRHCARLHGERRKSLTAISVLFYSSHSSTIQ